MFRISRYLKALHSPGTTPAHPPPGGPVVIWNLIRRCNLNCMHCYTTSADRDFPGELDTAEVFRVMDDLHAYGVSVLILSGGEPLLRPDIFDISRRAREMGFYVGLSSNGTLITEQNIDRITAVGYDYVGVSLDGLQQHHDRFRRSEGAFEQSLDGIRLCRDRDLKVGVRFTLAQENATDLPGLLTLMDRERIDKFYLSHLNYSGRGRVNRKEDAYHQTTRWALELLFQHCWDELERGVVREYVTGNNDADGVFLLQWIRRNHPQHAETLEARLRRWGGNASGIGIANIDNLGDVHPDTFWWHHTLGNVRKRPFSEIWEDLSDPILAGLRQRPRPLKGRCAGCGYMAVCGGNTRIRAYQTSGDLWAEDPGCYLSDSEIAFADNPRVHAPLVDARPRRRRPAKAVPIAAAGVS